MYRKKNSQWLRHNDFLLVDIFITLFSQLLAGIIYGRSLLMMMDDFHPTLFIFSIFILIIIKGVFRPHKGIIQRGYWNELASMAGQYLVFEALLITCLFICYKTWQIPRGEIALSMVIAFPVIYSIRLLLKHIIREDILKSDRRNKMVLITSAERLGELWEQMTIKSYPNYRITAIVLTEEDQSNYLPEAVISMLHKINEIKTDTKGFAQNRSYHTQSIDQLTILYGPVQTEQYMKKNIVDEIFLDYQGSLDVMKQALNEFFSMGITVHFGLPGVDYEFPNRCINHYGNRLAITTNINMKPSWQLSIKRAMDIAGALVGLVILGISFIFVIPGVMLSDPGPIFFVQTRIGRNGRPFSFYKFRSMYTDAEKRKTELMGQNQMKGLMFKLENDPRIIGSEKGPGKGYGNFIRRTSIDELPQFINILKGDMSLVGTRPPTLNEYKQYESRHKARLSMRPGLTGLWQVSGRSDITDFEEVVKMDCEYIESWSIGLDIKIIFKTILIILGQNGAK